MTTEPKHKRKAGASAPAPRVESPPPSPSHHSRSDAKKDTAHAAEDDEHESAQEDADHHARVASKKQRTQLQLVTTAHTSSASSRKSKEAPHAASRTRGDDSDQPQGVDEDREEKKETSVVRARPACAKHDAVMKDDKDDDGEHKTDADKQLAVPTDEQKHSWTASDVKKLVQAFKPKPKVSAAIASAETIYMLINDEHNDPSEHILNVLMHKEFIVAMMKYGRVMTNCPNTAVLCESMYYNRHIHFLEMWQHVERDLQVSRGKGASDYINITVKYPQNMAGMHVDTGYHFISAFSKVLPFTTWGPTKATGVEGSTGREIDGKTVPISKAQYSNVINNAMWHPHIVNATYDDSVVTTMLKWVQEVLVPDITRKVFSIPAAMTQARKRVMDMVANNSSLKPPKTGAEFAELCLDSPSFKLCLKTNQSSLALDVGCGVHRSAADKYEYVDKKRGKCVQQENLAAIPFPTDAFKLGSCVYNEDKDVRQTHRRLPMLVCRRSEEVDATRAALPHGHKDAYTGAYELVPFENAVIKPSDIACNLIQPSEYENKFDKAGAKMRLKGWIRLTNQMDLNDLLSKGPVQPVDPRFSIPCAGKYTGPVDQLRDHNSAYHANETANTEASARAAAAANLSDDEMMKAADAAQAFVSSK